MINNGSFLAERKLIVSSRWLINFCQLTVEDRLEWCRISGLKSSGLCYFTFLQWCCAKSDRGERLM